MNQDEKNQKMATLLIHLFNRLETIAPVDLNDDDHDLVREVGAISRGEI